MHNTRMKVATRNNLLRKLSNSKWGAIASTIRTTALALCYGQNPAERRLESRNCFLRSADFPPKVIRCSAWIRRLQAIPHRATVNIDESLAKGFDRPWTTWKCLNRLRTGFTCSKEQRQRWRYYEREATCECGLATENTAHMMQYTLLAQPCSLDDLNKFNDTAKKCVERWKTLV